MTNIDNWERQSGGLYLAVTPFDKNNSEHQDAAVSVVRKVAQVHGAAFSESGFRNNMAALYAGDIKIDLFLAKWEVCNPIPLCLGAALNWNTVGIDTQGQIARSIYTEDVCLLSDKLRRLIKEKPEGKEFPQESLAECFERISLQNMFQKDGAWFRYGEVNFDNTKMMRSLDGNGALIGTGSDSAVLEFKQLPNDLLDRFPMDVKVIALRKDGILDNNNFMVRWHEDNHDIRLIATKGQATAIGQPRVDIRSWHNGNLPEQNILDCVLASSLLAIKQEIEIRNWGNQQSQNIAARTFESPMPDAHIHIINDKRMIDALTVGGAAPRLFGEKPMIPGVNVLKSGLTLAA